MPTTSVLLRISNSKCLSSTYALFSSEIRPPTLPSNLKDSTQQEAALNSVGFYADLISRLDEQINATEGIFKQSFSIV